MTGCLIGDTHADALERARQLYERVPREPSFDDWLDGYTQRALIGSVEEVATRLREYPRGRRRGGRAPPPPPARLAPAGLLGGRGGGRLGVVAAAPHAAGPAPPPRVGEDPRGAGARPRPGGGELRPGGEGAGGEANRVAPKPGGRRGRGAEGLLPAPPKGPPRAPRGRPRRRRRRRTPAKTSRFGSRSSRRPRWPARR